MAGGGWRRERHRLNSSTSLSQAMSTKKNRAFFANYDGEFDRTADNNAGQKKTNTILFWKLIRYIFFNICMAIDWNQQFVCLQIPVVFLIPLMIIKCIRLLQLQCATCMQIYLIIIIFSLVLTLVRLLRWENRYILIQASAAGRKKERTKKLEINP